MIDLDRPLVAYQPDLFASEEPDLRRITARMILSHSSGLDNFGHTPPEALNFAPGAGFQYSGLGYARLQQVIERLTGKTLEALAREHVFQPLGMASSSYVWRPDLEPRLVLGHDAEGAPLSKRRKPARGNAAWSLYSTASDYARFVAFLLNRSDQDGPAADMLARQIRITDQISWGLGWGLQETTPTPSLWHWGGNPGFRSYVVAYPREKIGIVVLSNGENMFKMIEPTILGTIGGALPSYHWF